VLDFTSALYLGLRHPSWSLRQWSQFTTGVPAALASPPDAQAVAEELAALQGCEWGLLGASTLHLFWDAFGLLASRPVAVYVDSGTYPIARWGVERAVARGAPVREFAHHDAQRLRAMLRQDGGGGLRPLVVTDGFCPTCGRPAPLDAYMEAVHALGGLLIVDDTQALGIFGHSPGPDAPYGRGGGGMLARLGLCGPNVLVISSLAKAFGVPVATLSGSRKTVKEVELKSETRMHCSPPSLPVIRAAQHALAINRAQGDRLRLRLARLIARFRHGSTQAGFRCGRDLFPVQTISLARDAVAVDLYGQLLRRGVRTVLHSAHNRRALQLSFVFSTRHTFADIDHAVAALAESGTVAGVRSQVDLEVYEDDRQIRSSNRAL
jgi:8-amino-7-oxononanoate synthase